MPLFGRGWSKIVTILFGMGEMTIKSLLTGAKVVYGCPINKQNRISGVYKVNKKL